jgi:MFS family permease
MSVTGQYSGNGLGYFNTVIYAKIGVTSVVMQLAYNLVYAVVSAIGALFGALLSDRMPRRLPLVYGTLICAGWLAINAGLQGKIDALTRAKELISPALGKGALATYFMFTFCFMFSYTPLQAVVPVEALENTMRAKGLGFGSIISGSMGFLNQFAGPIALEHAGYKYIIFFAVWDVVEAGLWWMFGVEGQGRTLEELAWVYDQPNPVKASKNVNKVGHAEDGAVGL